jgi:hypothetical protein
MLEVLSVLLLRNEHVNHVVLFLNASSCGPTKMICQSGLLLQRQPQIDVQPHFC